MNDQEMLERAQSKVFDRIFNELHVGLSGAPETHKRVIEQFQNQLRLLQVAYGHAIWAIAPKETKKPA